MHALTKVLILTALLSVAAGYSCPMSCYSASDSDCGFGQLDSCTQTDEGDVLLQCKNPCTQIILGVNGCSRTFTCGWWERMWDCLINVFPLLLRALQRMNTVVHYIVSGIFILIGFWLCYRGVKDSDGTAFFTGFFAGTLLGFAVGESYGFDSTDTVIYLGIFCLGGGLLLALLFTTRDNALGYFFMGGCLPAVAVWFAIHIFVKDHSHMLIALACGCPLVFVISGGLFLKYRKKLGMGLFSSLLGAAMMVQGGLYLAFKDNLQTCWTDNTNSLLFAAILLPLSFFGGLLSQRAYLKSEPKDAKHRHINEHTAYLNEVLY